MKESTLSKTASVAVAKVALVRLRGNRSVTIGDGRLVLVTGSWIGSASWLLYRHHVWTCG